MGSILAIPCDVPAQFLDFGPIAYSPQVVCPVFSLVLRLEPRPRINLSIAVRIADIRDYSVHLPLREEEEKRILALKGVAAP